MIPPNKETLESIKRACNQYPMVLEWVETWYKHELNQLPNTFQNTALAQGRCQVLGELCRVLREPPETRA